MAKPRIEDLFDEHRFPDGWSLILVLFYLPLGIFVAILRIFIGLNTFLAACILPKYSTLRRAVLRVMCLVLGVVVTAEDDENRKANAKVIVANYTSTLDHLAVNLIEPCILPCVWDLPPVMMWLLGYKEMGAKQGKEVLIQNTKRHCQDSEIPLLVFPEGASTNGKVGLLKFSVWPFSLEQHIQPIIINVSRPSIVQLAPSVIGGRWWIDVFWFLFVPYTHFRLKVLPVMARDPEDTTEEFTKKVQELMASKLNVVATTHTSADKVEYTKRKFFVPPEVSGRVGGGQPSESGDGGDPTIATMAQQVQDVLPHVPLHTIKRDLILTKDVDLTITNILEGRIQVDLPGQEARPNTTASTASSNNKASSKTFFKNSKDRQLSFEERKQILLESARKKYMAKHGMN